MAWCLYTLAPTLAPTPRAAQSQFPARRREHRAVKAYGTSVRRAACKAALAQLWVSSRRDGGQFDGAVVAACAGAPDNGPPAWTERYSGMPGADRLSRHEAEDRERAAEHHLVIAQRDRRRDGHQRALQGRHHGVLAGNIMCRRCAARPKRHPQHPPRLPISQRKRQVGPAPGDQRGLQWPGDVSSATGRNPATPSSSARLSSRAGPSCPAAATSAAPQTGSNANAPDLIRLPTGKSNSCWLR